MTDFSVTLPFSTGVFAAIIFLIFEVIIFPLTLYATSKVAALTLQARAEKGMFIRVKSILFPFWNDGLLNNQKSHWLLLIFRVIIIGIPVYLETRLISSERSIFQCVVIPHAFEVNPKTNWVLYGNTSGDAIITLRENAERVFSRCTSYGNENWVIASVANVTYMENRNIDELQCVNGTEKRLYRQSRELPENVIPSNISILSLKHRSNFSALVSISFGTTDSFPDSPEIDRLSSPDFIYRVENITLQNYTDIECFTENSANRFSNISSIPIEIMCHNITDNVADYYWGGTKGFDFSNGEANRTFKNGTVEFGSSTLDINLYLVSRLEFHDKVIVTAEHIANIDFIQKLPVTPADFESRVRRLLYTKADNRPTTVRLNSKQTETKLDYIFIIIAIVETVCVILFGTLMLLISKYNLRLQEIPTTLNGLSQCWAHQASSSCAEADNENHVTLRLRVLGYKPGMQPSLTYCSENAEEGIFDHVDTGRD